MGTNETATWTLMMINVVLVISLLQSCVCGEPRVPCFLIFGDSLADNGNNNRLQTPSRGNYKPYGIDFPQGPTGRFTNGRTIVDILAELLGFEDPIPCFANTRGYKNIVRGLNYESASAGLRDETGSHMTMHKYGVRKVALVGVSDIPFASGAFNQKLVLLNADLKDAKFIYVNTSLVTRSTSSGIKYTFGLGYIVLFTSAIFFVTILVLHAIIPSYVTFLL